MGFELARGDPSGGRLPLIRASHIFAAAVREIIEQLLSELVDDGLTPKQLDALRYISLSRHHVDEVAKFLRISASAATKFVDQLERRGLVARVYSLEDRRLHFLECTEKGKELMRRLRESEEERLGSIFETFGAEELVALAWLLERYSIALVSSQALRNVPCLRCSGYFDVNCPLALIHSRCPYQERVDP